MLCNRASIFSEMAKASPTKYSLTRYNYTLYAYKSFGLYLTPKTMIISYIGTWAMDACSR